jgi:2'-5' RNA ligase
MRLFTAIIFDEDTKEKIYEIEEALRSISKRGSFTTKENLHLTVNFIGETKRLEEVKQAMNQAAESIHYNGFILKIGGFGRFKRREGDIYWVGVEKGDILCKLQKQLVKELKEAGFFEIDDMEYTPHLTLGRRVMIKDDYNTKEFEAGIKPISMKADRISLMKSERLDGKLVYTEIYNIKLNQ